MNKILLLILLTSVTTSLRLHGGGDEEQVQLLQGEEQLSKSKKKLSQKETHLQEWQKALYLQFKQYEEDFIGQNDIPSTLQTYQTHREHTTLTLDSLINPAQSEDQDPIYLPHIAAKKIIKKYLNSFYLNG